MAEHLLVTGGAGYVGSHAVAALAARGYDVTVLDDLRQGHARAAEVAGGRLVVGDLADRALLQDLFRRSNFSAVLHFAANSLVGESMRQPFRYLGENVTNAANLIELALANGVDRFILSSTCAIFGNPPRVPIDEETPIDPGNPYGESKYLIERMLRWAERIHGLRYASLRYFNAAGAHPDLPLGEDHAPETHLIPIALEAALGRRSGVDIFGTDYDTPDGTCIRDYVHVCDLADAHVRVLEALDRSSRCYNLGSGHGYSVREVLDAVQRVTERRFPIQVSPRRAGDPPILVASPQRILRELGWRAAYRELDTIVATAWEWRRKHPQGFTGDLAAT